MRFVVCFGTLVILAAATMWAAPDGGLHISISLQSLQQLDVLASGKIESLDDATAYVRKSAALCVLGDSDPMAEGIESRLAAAELDAAKDPNKLVSDERVAEAFNFMSDEFRVEHPARLTASDILQYRSVQASIFPHVFSPKTASGSRPVGAIVMLYQLWYNGGVTEGVRKAAQLDRPPGSLKVASGQSVSGRSGLDKNPNLTGREYQVAGYAYFAQRSPQQKRSFLDRIAKTIALPQERCLVGA